MADRDWLRLPQSAPLLFGGFNGRLPHSGEEAGDRLVKIANAMAYGQPVPPELALWFFQAVKAGIVPQTDPEAPVAINADRFMRALGLANAVGDDGRYSAIFKAHWTGRLYEIRNRIFAQAEFDFESNARADGKAWPPKRGSKLYVEWQAVRARNSEKAAVAQVLAEMKAEGINPPAESTLRTWLAGAENPAINSGR